jgi:hypothetical protein
VLRYPGVQRLGQTATHHRRIVDASIAAFTVSNVVAGIEQPAEQIEADIAGFIADRLAQRLTWGLRPHLGEQLAGGRSKA